MEKHNLYIKIAQITKECIEKAPEMELLPIFIDSDLRSNNLISCYHKTAIHFPNLAPSRYLTSKYRAGLDKSEFDDEYFTELLSKDWKKIIDRLEFLVELSGALGVIFMGGLESPEFLTEFKRFLNKSEMFNNPVEELRIDQEER